MVTPTSTPAPKPAHYAVLVDLLSDSRRYTISVFDSVGRQWNSFTVAQRTAIATPSGHAVTLPYVSTTSSALYYLDGDTAVDRQSLDGRVARVAKLPVSAGMEGAFAISADDKAMAIGVLDFNRSPVHVTLYIQSLVDAAPPHVIYQSDTDYVWPVAWHGGLVVLAHAFGPFEDDIAQVAPGRDNPYSAVSYHLIDPQTADRRVLMGSCTVSGPLTAAGTACIQGDALGWNGTLTSWGLQNWGTISAAASLSPDGKWVAAPIPSNPSHIGIWRPTGGVIGWVDGAGTTDWTGWLDENTIVTGSYVDPKWTAEVVNVISGIGGTEYFTPYHGYFAAVLPTDLST